MLTKQQVKNNIEADVVDKLIVNSISPTNVGKNMQDVVDLICDECVTTEMIDNWNEAYDFYINFNLDIDWGSIANTPTTIEGYGINNVYTKTEIHALLDGIGGGIGTETDPIFTASPAFDITDTNIENWNTTFGWGNHALAGYWKTTGNTVGATAKFGTIDDFDVSILHSNVQVGLIHNDGLRLGKGTSAITATLDIHTNNSTSGNAIIVKNLTDQTIIQVQNDTSVIIPLSLNSGTSGLFRSGTDRIQYGSPGTQYVRHVFHNLDSDATFSRGTNVVISDNYDYRMGFSHVAILSTLGSNNHFNNLYISGSYLGTRNNDYLGLEGKYSVYCDQGGGFYNRSGIIVFPGTYSYNRQGYINNAYYQNNSLTEGLLNITGDFNTSFVSILSTGNIENSVSQIRIKKFNDFEAHFGFASLSVNTTVVDKINNFSQTGIIRHSVKEVNGFITDSLLNSNDTTYRGFAVTNEIDATFGEGSNKVFTGFEFNPVITDLGTLAPLIAFTNTVGENRFNSLDNIYGTLIGNNILNNYGARNPSAILDVVSETRGVVFPRMNTEQRNAIISPIAGLLIFNTSTGVYNFFNGSTWNAI